MIDHISSPSPFQGEGRGEGSIAELEHPMPGENPHPSLLPVREKEFLHPRNLTLVKPARRLRRNMTDVEQKLWYHLRGRRFENTKFRRQYPIGNYIVDFICVDKRLIIEIDGGQHCDNIKDIVRDDWLKAQGYCIVRFWNNEINENREGVLQHIAEMLMTSPSPFQGEGRGEGSIAELERSMPGENPHPSLLPKREKGQEEENI